jgi:tetratricopeptide (TPR) repeat protein
MKKKSFLALILYCISCSSCFGSHSGSARELDEESGKLWDKHKRAEAIDCLNKAISLARDNKDNEMLHDAIRGIAYYYEMSGKYDNAVQNYTTVIRMESSSNELSRYLTGTYIRRAETYEKMGRHAQAVQDYSLSIKVRPTSEAYEGRSISYRKLGNLKLALLDTKKAKTAGTLECPD